ncbi:hypothetical protein ABK040_007720 [Willaertia magna]
MEKNRKELSFTVQNQQKSNAIRRNNVLSDEIRNSIEEDNDNIYSEDFRDENKLKRKFDDEIIPCKSNTFTSNSKKRNIEDEDLKSKEEFKPKKSVQGFGLALLKGMGYVEGKPFGRSDKIVEPIEPQPRPPLSGIGSDLKKQLELSKNKKLKDRIKIVEEKEAPKKLKSIEEQVDKENSSSSRILHSNWVLPNLYVRYLGKGKHYLKKGVIIDVPSPSECILSMDESNTILEHVKESDLETVIPRKEGVLCICVGGENIGQTGKLLSKDKKKETCLLKTEDDEIIEVSFDNCCEYRDTI